MGFTRYLLFFSHLLENILLCSARAGAEGQSDLLDHQWVCMATSTGAVGDSGGVGIATTAGSAATYRIHQQFLSALHPGRRRETSPAAERTVEKRSAELTQLISPEAKEAHKQTAAAGRRPPELQQERRHLQLHIRGLAMEQSRRRTRRFSSSHAPSLLGRAEGFFLLSSTPIRVFFVALQKEEYTKKQKMPPHTHPHGLAPDLPPGLEEEKEQAWRDSERGIWKPCFRCNP